jgi:ribosomal protein S30
MGMPDAGCRSIWNWPKRPNSSQPKICLSLTDRQTFQMTLHPKIQPARNQTTETPRLKSMLAFQRQTESAEQLRHLAHNNQQRQEPAKNETG